MQNKDKRVRIFFDVSQEQYDGIKKDAGQIPLSKYVRGKFFSPEIESLRVGSMKQWVDLLSRIPERDELLKNLLSFAKKYESDPAGVLLKRLT